MNKLAIIALVILMIPMVTLVEGAKPSPSYTNIVFAGPDITSNTILSTSTLSANEFLGHGTLNLVSVSFLITIEPEADDLRGFNEGDLQINIKGGKSKTATMSFLLPKRDLNNDGILDHILLYSIAYPADVIEVSKTERRIVFKNDKFDLYYILSTPQDTPLYIGHYYVWLTFTIVLSTT